MDLAKAKVELVRKIQTRFNRDGRTIRKLADDTGISKSQIHKILTEKNPNVSLEHVLIVCQELRIPFELIYKAR